MPTASPWYLITSDAQRGSPVALLSDREQAERFLREHCPHGQLSKVDVSHCVVHPIIETVNEHHPILLGGNTYERVCIL
jgi:hypothetical protein